MRKLSHFQRSILKSLNREPGRYICRWGYSFRLCDEEGLILDCIRKPTVHVLTNAGCLMRFLGCPNATRREHDEHWRITERGQEVLKQ